VLLGGALSAAGFLRVYVTNGSLLNSSAIGLSVLAIVTTSCLLGSGLPFLLARAGVDPANAGTSIQVRHAAGPRAAARGCVCRAAGGRARQPLRAVVCLDASLTHPHTPTPHPINAPPPGHHGRAGGGHHLCHLRHRADPARGYSRVTVSGRHLLPPTPLPATPAERSRASVKPKTRPRAARARTRAAAPPRGPPPHHPHCVLSSKQQHPPSNTCALLGRPPGRKSRAQPGFTPTQPAPSFWPLAGPAPCSSAVHPLTAIFTPRGRVFVVATVAAPSPRCSLEL
jgi:hypothetical protein